MGFWDFLRGTPKEEESAQARVDRLRREAERAKARSPARAPAAPPAAGPSVKPQVSVQTVSLGGGHPEHVNALDPAQVAEAAGSAVEQVEHMLGQDLDGDGRVGSAGVARSQAHQQVSAHLASSGQPQPPPAAAAPAGDAERKLTALARLERLRAAGALTDAEFEREKQRLGT